MLRKLLLGFGFAELAKPRPIIDACERIGLENPSATERRPQALRGARLEGLVFVWTLLRERDGSTVITALLGLAGTILVVLPRPIIELSQSLVDENTAELELKPWVVRAARLLGALYLLVVALSRPASGDSSPTDGTGA
ncbi:hypothetical protein [Natrialba asiatica]|uniref:Uncharacterized protein n=1 Tax=Natrialba asiatica (strain ATCC 700177 / DSM 12278 / JCM 9576 / FERM P-10747 / NBRC 102637 / 172P1) TaxID=29540 RepID=M0AJE9_NATA1|nr:hypothetical protein [Natrialba asiatica]ELY97997.1 hypothetical protein C481_18715 [Natrialba asiatica DSM 12278]